MVRQGEEARQGIAVQLRELRRRHPLQESFGGLGVLGRRIHAEGDVGVVGDVAGVGAFRQRRREDAHLEVRLLFEQRRLPRTRRVDGALAEGEVVLRVGVGLGLEASGQVVLPLRQTLPHLHILRVGELLCPLDQAQTTCLALPVVRPDVLEAHRRRFPLVVRAHHQRGVRAVGLDLVEQGEELRLCLRLLQPQLLEGVGVVEEAVDDRRHRHAEHIRAVVGDPGTLGYVAEVLHAGQVVERGQIALLEQGQRGVERPAGDEVAGRAALQLGVQHAVVLRRRGGGEDNLDVGVVLVEGGDDRVLPDGQVIVAPAFDGKGDFLAGGGGGGFLGGGGGRLSSRGLGRRGGRGLGGLGAAAGSQQDGQDEDQCQNEEFARHGDSSLSRLGR